MVAALRGAHVVEDRGIAVDLRHRLVVPVPEPVDPAHQRRRAPPDRRAHRGRDVEQRQPDARPVGPVRQRAVHRALVMDRELALRQLQVDRLRFVQPLDGLAAPQQIVVVRRLAVPVGGPEVRARDHPHAAVGPVAVGQRDPDRRQRVRIEPEIGRILVPRDEPPRARRLDPELRGEQQDVRADQVLHRVDDLGPRGERVRPREAEMALHVDVAGGEPARRLERLERFAHGRGLAGAEPGQRREIAVLAIKPDLPGGEAARLRFCGNCHDGPSSQAGAPGSNPECAQSAGSGAPYPAMIPSAIPSYSSHGAWRKL